MEARILIEQLQSLECYLGVFEMTFCLRDSITVVPNSFCAEILFEL